MPALTRAAAGRARPPRRGPRAARRHPPAAGPPALRAGDERDRRALARGGRGPPGHDRRDHPLAARPGAREPAPHRRGARDRLHRVCAALDEAALAGVRASEVARRHLWSCADCRAYQRDLRTAPVAPAPAGGLEPVGHGRAAARRRRARGRAEGRRRRVLRARRRRRRGRRARAGDPRPRRAARVASLQPELVIQQAAKDLRRAARSRPPAAPAAAPQAASVARDELRRGGDLRAAKAKAERRPGSRSARRPAAPGTRPASPGGRLRPARRAAPRRPPRGRPRPRRRGALADRDSRSRCARSRCGTRRSSRHAARERAALAGRPRGRPNGPANGHAAPDRRAAPRRDAHAASARCDATAAPVADDDADAAGVAESRALDAREARGRR